MEQRLEIQTLGGLRILLDGQPLPSLASRKAELLLVYLASSQRVHAREVLAELLWDDRTQAQALGNLRVVLSSLNKALGELIHIQRERVKLASGDLVWLDAAALETALAAWNQRTGPADEMEIAALEGALAHYQGEFLEGEYPQGARGYESWMVAERERLHHLALQGLGSLIDCLVESGAYARAIDHVHRFLELDPLAEAAHRQMMKLLALSGRRSAALEQYGQLAQLLQEELGVEPDAETTALYHQIQDGEIEKPASVCPPSLLKPQPPPPLYKVDELPAPIFVARENELHRLDGMLAQAAAGRGGLCLVCGGPGAGKTALLAEFARQGMQAHPELLAASGSCVAIGGTGDPYLPFRRILGQLSGDLSTQFLGNPLRLEHCRRLWDNLPLAVQVLGQSGKDLLESFIAHQGLRLRLEQAYADRPAVLEDLRSAVQPPTEPTGLGQKNLYEQYTQVLLGMAAHKPLLLLLDDLQWADSGTVHLLFHLGSAVRTAPILLVCAFRAEEIEQERETRPHALSEVLVEFKRQFGDVTLDLECLDAREELGFVSALLDTEPNTLTAGFRKNLHERTRGNPLFTLELLRDMQESGALAKDDQERWYQASPVVVQALPARVEAVIESRLARLDDERLHILRAAAVQGVSFTAEALSQVTGKDPLLLVRQLSGDLARKHHLVEEQAPLQVDGRVLRCYSFNHMLYQQHLYASIGGYERQLMHASCAAALEALYGEHSGQIAGALAWHYQQAGEKAKAAHYLLLSGDQHRTLYSHEEAITAYEQALQILRELHDFNRTAQTLMKLGLSYHQASDYARSQAAFDDSFALWRQAALHESQQAQSLAPQTLHIASIAVQHLDLSLETIYTAGDVLRQLFSGLVEITPDLDVVPCEAESWEILGGGQGYVFHLRQGLRWSDGMPLTAHDYEFAWKRILDPALNSANAPMFYLLQEAQAYHQGLQPDPDQVGVKALDDHTLLVELGRSTSYFLSWLTMPVTAPLPRHILQEYGADWWVNHLVGNGAFMLDSFEFGEKIVLKRNPYYTGIIRGNLEGVEIAILDQQQEFECYLRGQLDIFDAYPKTIQPTRAIQILQEHAGEYRKFEGRGVIHLAFNLHQPPFVDLRVRRAFIQAIDKDEIIEKSYGFFRLGSGGVTPPGMPGHLPGIALPFNPQLANSLLVQAGVRGMDINPPLRLFVGKLFEWFGELLCEQWLRYLGIPVKLELVDLFYDAEEDIWELARKTPLQLGAWSSDYPDPHNYLADCLTLHSWWLDQEYLGLVERARGMTEESKRMALYHQMERYLVDQAIAAPLVYSQQHYLMKPWVRYYPVSPLLWKYLKDVIMAPRPVEG